MNKFKNKIYNINVNFKFHNNRTIIDSDINYNIVEKIYELLHNDKLRIIYFIPVFLKIEELSNFR